MHAHSGSIWDLDFLPSSAAHGADLFVTCGADSTVRLWGLPPHETNQNAPAEDEAAKKDAPFKDLRAMAVCVDPHVAGGAADGAQAQSSGGIRCVKVSPDGRRVVSGDRMGNLRVHSLANGNLQMETFLEAHDAEILALDFGGEQGNLLASAGMAGCVSVSVSVSLSVSVSVSVSAFCMALDVWAT
jgi:WD40 repeat protein